MSNTRVCVYGMCRQELRRVQSSAGDGHGQSHGPALDPASLPSLPLHILVFRAQTSTQISIHSLSVSSSPERGEGRVRKDRKGQSVSDRLGSSAFVCVVLFFGFVVFTPESRGRLRQKGHLVNCE